MSFRGKLLSTLLLQRMGWNVGMQTRHKFYPNLHLHPRLGWLTGRSTIVSGRSPIDLVIQWPEECASSTKACARGQRNTFCNDLRSVLCWVARYVSYLSSFCTSRCVVGGRGEGETGGLTLRARSLPPHKESVTQEWVAGVGDILHSSGDGRRKMACAHVLCALLHLGRWRGYLACPKRTSKVCTFQQPPEG
jgi:hypothetical protein